MLRVSVGREPGGGVEPVLAVGDDVEHATRDEAGSDLGTDVGRCVPPLEATPSGQTEGDGRVEVPTGDVPDGVDHRQHGQAEGEGDTDEADAQPGVLAVAQVLRGEDRTAAAAEDEPEGAEELRTESVGQGVGHRGLLKRRGAGSGAARVDQRADGAAGGPHPPHRGGRGRGQG